MMYDLRREFEKKRVAIYARVSTEHEAQLSALGNQIDWYKPILAAHKSGPWLANPISMKVSPVLRLKNVLIL